MSQKQEWFIDTQKTDNQFFTLQNFERSDRIHNWDYSESSPIFKNETISIYDTFNWSSDREGFIIELEENYYNRNEICYYLNEALLNNNISIKSSINDDNFVFTSNTKFDMINDNGSILSYLGYNKNSYTNKNEYKANNTLKLGNIENGAS